ncbi:hypothetical protein BC832DRAFT_540982 [Gaertneriomyces semiglobifer]|nr:hypothetical protein BC832DRAFT_540982 [Gaertneriomyces semiglobifer]
MSMVNAVVRNGANERLAVIYVGRGPQRSVSYEDVVLYLSILTHTSIEDIRTQYCLQPGTKHISGRAEPALFPSRKPSRSPSVASITEEMEHLKVTEQPSTEEDTANPEVVKCYARFTLSLAMRDRRCIVTRNANPDVLEGARIIPHSWKSRQYTGLPDDIRDTLLFEYSTMGVDDIRNGALMERSVHTSFRFAVLAPQHIIGTLLATPDVGEGNAGERYEDMFINRRFLEFHLQTGLRHMPPLVGTYPPLPEATYPPLWGLDEVDLCDRSSSNRIVGDHENSRRRCRRGLDVTHIGESMFLNTKGLFNIAEDDRNSGIWRRLHEMYALAGGREGGAVRERLKKLKIPKCAVSDWIPMLVELFTTISARELRLRGRSSAEH